MMLVVMPRPVAWLVVQPAVGARDEQRAARRLGAEAGVVEGELLSRVDPGTGPAAGRPVELVDVGAVLVRTQAAGLAGAVGKDQDVVGHDVLAGQSE
jgi:hypothetical protein